MKTSAVPGLIIIVVGIAGIVWYFTRKREVPTPPGEPVPPPSGELPPGFPEPPPQPPPGTDLPPVPPEVEWLVDSLMENLGYSYEQAVIAAVEYYRKLVELGESVQIVSHGFPVSMSRGEPYRVSPTFILPYESRSLFTVRFLIMVHNNYLDLAQWQLQSGGYKYADAELVAGVNILPAKEVTVPRVSRVGFFGEAEVPAGTYDLLCHIRKSSVYGEDTIGYPDYVVWKFRKVGGITVV